ncbi:MAG: hypothetical protein AAGK32_22085, partial [Actinomycetota bacterium]
MADSSDDRRARHYELLKKSRDALSAEQGDRQAVDAGATDPGPATPSEPDPSGSDGADGGGGSGSGGVMYRGRRLAGSPRLATPGAGTGSAQARRFRGASGRKRGRGRTPTPPARHKAEDVERAIRKLTRMHDDGLITTQ